MNPRQVEATRRPIKERIHYCLVETDACGNRHHLDVDRETARKWLEWTIRLGKPYRIDRRKTRFGRPAIDLCRVKYFPLRRVGPRVGVRIPWRTAHASRSEVAA